MVKKKNKKNGGLTTIKKHRSLKYSNAKTFFGSQKIPALRA